MSSCVSGPSARLNWPCRIVSYTCIIWFELRRFNGMLTRGKRYRSDVAVKPCTRWSYFQFYSSDSSRRVLLMMLMMMRCSVNEELNGGDWSEGRRSMCMGLAILSIILRDENWHRKCVYDTPLSIIDQPLSISSSFARSLLFAAGSRQPFLASFRRISDFLSAPRIRHYHATDVSNDLYFLAVSILDGLQCIWRHTTL